MAQCGSVLGLQAAKGLSHGFRHGLSRFEDESKLRENVRGGPSGSVAQWKSACMVARDPRF